MSESPPRAPLSEGQLSEAQSTDGQPPEGQTPERSQSPEGPLPRGLPRFFEILIAIQLLVLTSPILAVAWLAIRLTSAGPGIFRQTRIGRAGRPFELLKLRTMRSRAGGSLLTAEADRRVTPVGRVLRATKIDELPQLWNVLVGEMSLVGPRPEVSGFVELDSPTWRRVLSARPGITDPVSIRLRDEARWIEALGGDPERTYRERLLPWKLAGYLDYLEQRDPWRDLGVLWQTLVAVLLAGGEEPTASEIPSPSEGPLKPSGDSPHDSPHDVDP